MPGFVALIGETPFDDALQPPPPGEPFRRWSAATCAPIPVRASAAAAALDEAVAHPQPEAVHDRAGDRDPASGRSRERRERGAQSGRHRQRAGRSFVRVLPRPLGLQAHHLREGAESGRHAGAGHTGLPTATLRAAFSAFS